MNEPITKALQVAQLLDSDLRGILRDIYKGAIGKNDALLVLVSQLIEGNAKTITILSQLGDV